MTRGVPRRPLVCAWEEELTLGKGRESNKLGLVLRVTPARVFGHQSPHQSDSGGLQQLGTAPCPPSLYLPGEVGAGGGAPQTLP